MEHIIAVDPGRTSGIAIAIGDQVETKVITDPHELYLLVFSQVWSAVICEDFITNTIDAHGLYTVRLVGAVQALAAIRGSPIVIHTPGQRYPWIPKAKALLKGQKHMVHEVDALAHLLRYRSGIRNRTTGSSLRGQIASAVGLPIRSN